jgi:NitT/TauT family transport system permease protein
MFAALLMITTTGVALFGLMVLLERVLLSGWHESTMAPER